jgi:hypothetical protein
MSETMKRWCNECGTLLGMNGHAPEGDAALLQESNSAVADPKYQEARQLLYSNLMSVNVEQRRKTASSFSVKLLGILDAWINETLPIPSPVEMDSVTVIASDADAEAVTFAASGADAEAGTFAARGAEAAAASGAEAAASGADPDVNSDVGDNVWLAVSFMPHTHGTSH